MRRHVSVVVLLVVLVGLGACFGTAGYRHRSARSAAPAASRAAAPSTRDAVAENDGVCTMDIDCDVLEKCIKPTNGFGKGICGRPVDKTGMPMIGVGEAKTEGCHFDTECPALFECKMVNAFAGVCTKR